LENSTRKEDEDSAISKALVVPPVKTVANVVADERSTAGLRGRTNSKRPSNDKDNEVDDLLAEEQRSEALKSVEHTVVDGHFIGQSKFSLLFLCLDPKIAIYSHIHLRNEPKNKTTLQAVLLRVSS